MKSQLFLPVNHQVWANILFADRHIHPPKALVWGLEHLAKRRAINGIGFLCCASMLAYAYYLEFFEGLVPCPLCVLERLMVAILGFVFLVEAVHAPCRCGTTRCYGALIALVSTVGVGVAGRHVWMQSLSPEDAVFCLPPLSYLLQFSSLTDTLGLILSVPGDCKTTDWTLLGLTIAAWSLLAFITLGTMGLICNWRRD